MSPPTQKAPSSGFQVDPMYVIIALLVIVISFLLTRRFRKTTKVVILVGLSESGKTALFTKLIFNKPKKSVTSLKEEEATLADLNLKLVDLPGAERLRPRLWEQYREKARNVIFVVDSTTVTSRLRDLSEYLYSLLSDPIIHKNKIGFTLACNKQDLPEAMRRDEMKTVLEKELTAIKETKKGQLGRTSEEETEDRLSSLFTDNISFDKLQVQLIETSVNNVDQLVRSIL
uniref:ADP-ribosylation factor-related protein 1 n=1 Tax=Aceria tosichella TaxID=561515 RepID=A0A6G1S9I6_9ACAR